MKVRFVGVGWAVLLVTVSILPCSAQPLRAATDTPQGGPQDAAYHGGLVTPPLPKPNFTLTDTSGAPFDFRAQTDGYVTLLFFGFTHCTSICPTQMQILAGAMRQVPKEVSDRIKVVFVTTDPEHDNPRLLRTWLNNFNKSFIGLTGSGAGVRAAQVAANVPSGGDASEHAAFVLAYTSDNLGHLIYPAGITQADWLHDLPRLVREPWTKPSGDAAGPGN